MIALLGEGSDPNARDAGGDAALTFASTGGHSVAVKTLSARGADPLWRARSGRTAPHFAASRQHREAASLLERAGDKAYREAMRRLEAEF